MINTFCIGHRLLNNLYAQFYKGYPQIVQTLSGQLRLPLSIEQKMQTLPVVTGVSALSPDIQMLLNQLSFSHFIEFLKCDTPLQRAFYETYALKNQWTVRDLQRGFRNNFLSPNTSYNCPMWRN